MTYLDLVEVVFNIVLKSFCSGWYFMPTLVFLFTTARKDDHAQVKSKDWVNDSYHMLVRSPYRSLAFFSLGHLKKKINNKIHTSITYQPKRKSDFGSMHQEFPKATKSHLDQIVLIICWHTNMIISKINYNGWNKIKSCRIHLKIYNKFKLKLINKFDRLLILTGFILLALGTELTW